MSVHKNESKFENLPMKKHLLEIRIHYYQLT